MSNSVLTNGKKSLNGMKRILLLVGLAVAAALPAQAADYVFMYGGGYLYVTNTGAVGYTTDFSRSCVWTCVSNTSDLTAATLGTGTSYWLYTEANGTRYWLVGDNGNGEVVTASETPGEAYWRTNGNYLYYYSGYTTYYLYYRDYEWKVSSQAGTRTSYGTTRYTGRNGSPDYRSTTSTVTTNNVADAITGSLSTPTITPSAAQTVEYNGSVSYTVSATGPTRLVPAHTTYTHNGTTLYYYNNQTYTSANAFATNNPAVTYTWALSGDGANGLELMSTSGENTIVKYTGSASGTTATLTVTARVGTLSRTASVTINVTPVEPTAISATDATVYVDNSGEVVYTLTPNYAYNRVAAVSGNTGIFTVTSPATGGTVAITPVAAGQATLTLTALNSGGTDGPSTSVTVTVRDICAAPQFSFSQSGSSVLATITTATTGATIRYTTDGTDPTPTTGTVYTGPFNVADGQTIKAIAVLGDYYDASEVVTKTVNPIDYVEQGVSGGIVTINDLEDHTWTYYSGVSSDLDGGNYNTNYLGRLYSPNPRNVKITYQANGGAVSIDESETEFVYYKTLEESATSGEYAYQVISNPFSKRPNGKGFGGWKIKEGADYIKGYNDEATLPLDAEIVFNNLPYSSVNCVSAEIELEATWENLNDITYASGNTFTYNVSGGNYETNILVLNRNVTGTITTTSPVTIMMVEPDGSSDYRGTYTFSGNIAPNNDGVTKIEWARWTTTGTINATGRDFTIGRGITRPSGGGSLQGTNTNRNINQTFKVESGIWGTFYAIGESGPENNMTKQNIILGNDYDRAKSDNTNLTITSNMMLLNRASAIGSDRLVVTSKSGRFTTALDHSTAQASGNCFYLWNNASTNGATGVRTLIIEGGEFWHIAGGVDYANSNDIVNLKFRMKGGTVHGSIYGGAARYDAHGSKQFVFTGGTVEGWIAGGSNGFLSEGTGSDNGSTQGNSYVYVGGTTQVNSNGSTTAINVALGGNVYGAGCGNEEVNVSGRVTQGTNVVVADNCYVERGVYGGGAYGSSPATANVYITGNAHVGGVDDPVFNVQGGVYGGARAKGGGTVNVYMSGGLVEQGVYGGSNASGTINNHITMHIDGGQVGTPTQHANIHGGGYGSNTVAGANIDLTLGKEDCNATGGVTVYGDVYGGSAEGLVNGTSPDPYYTTTVTLYHGTIYGGLYGGGLGSATHAADVNGNVAVKVYGGSVRTNDGTGENGSGGVFGCNNTNGTPKSTVTVDIYGTDPAPDANSFALYAVYGGGNRSDYTGVPVVTVHGCNNSIEYVYGGGNASAVRGTNVTIWGGHIGNAFGGGNGFSVTNNHDVASAPHYNPGANITASGANLTIHGGTIDAAFGGSNQWGHINGGITVAVAEQDESGSNPCTGAAYGSCSNLIVELYGGGNQAPAVTSGDVYISPDVTISSCDMKITNLFGGAKNANHGANINLVVEKGQFENVFGGNNLGGTITGNVTLTLKGGTMVNAFGGNNQGGSITGTITVLVDSTGNDCPLKVDNVYGGGNEAAYSPNDATAATPTVNFVNGTVRNAVFGGGLGSAAKITANPTVNIGGTGSKHAIVGGMRVDGVTPGVGNVYGGGSQADVLKDGDNTGNTSVTLSGHATVKGNVYGGGNEANVEGNSSVELEE